MPSLSQKLRQVEQAAQRLTRDRRQAVGLRKKIENRLKQTAAKQTRRPQQAALTELQLIKTLITSGRVGWVNDPSRNKAVLVERGTGCVVRGQGGKLISATRRRLKSTPAFSRTTFLQHLKHPDVENFVPHMYLDSAGKVTVGIGQLLPTVADAQMLQFKKRGTNVTATAREIANDFNSVLRANVPANAAAGAFRKFTMLEFSEPLAERLALQRMNEFIQFLRPSSAFPEFDTYPPTAKMGILDMAYTLGASGTVNGFPQFTAAVRRRNWKHAAFHSNRPQLRPQRNQIVRGWLNNAARLEPFFISHTSCRKNLSAISR